MYTKRELQRAIKECENAPANYQNIEKLAHLYTVYNHFFGEAGQIANVVDEPVIADYGGGDFYEVISGKDPARVWGIMNELMEAVAVLNPRLYDGTMAKLRE